MAISKIILNGVTQMDVTQNTVASNNLLDDYIATGADGNQVIGSVINNGATGGTIATQGGTYTIPAGYTSGGTVTASLPAMTLPTAIDVSAISGYTSKATVNRSTSDQYINIPTGYNSAGGYYKINAVPNGTAGTPTATKGIVSNHAISITPSVTNTTGYITGSTKTGTAVTVSASELVSGTKSITANGTGIDVTNYASVDVNVVGETYEDGDLIAYGIVSNSLVSASIVDQAIIES